MNIEHPDILLDDLAVQEKLSRRSVNVCTNHYLTSLYSILEYYLEFGGFLNLKNCGMTSNRELTLMCNKFVSPPIIQSDMLNLKFLSKEISESNIKKIKENLSSFSDEQNFYYYEFLQFLLLFLRNKIYLLLTEMAKSKEPREIQNILLDSEIDYFGIRSFGISYIKEIEKAKLELYEFSEILREKENEEFILEFTKFLSTRHFGLNSGVFEQNQLNIIKDNKINIFSLIKFLIENGCIFNSLQTKIFILGFTNENEKEPSTLSITKSFDLTRERVRQIRVELENKINNYLYFISIYHIHKNCFSYFDISQNVIQINNSIIKNINATENTDYKISFFVKIFKLLYINSHFVIGQKKYKIDFSKKKTQEKLVKKYRIFKNYYLINKKYATESVFEEFFIDLFKDINKRVIKTYEINFEEILSKYFKNENRQEFEEIKNICENIINREFNLFLDPNGNLKLKKNTKDLIYDYCYKVLDEAGKPLTIPEIQEAIKSNYPQVKINFFTVKYGLKSKPDLFINVKNNRTFALSKWNLDPSEYKYSSILKLVEEFLENYDMPQHISSITNYIKAYYDYKNERNVLSNIRYDKNNIYTIYPSNFVGLNSKKYDEEEINYIKIGGSIFSKKNLSKFLNLSLDEIIDTLHRKYDYPKIQLEFLLKQKEALGNLVLSEDRKLIEVKN